MHTDAAQAVGKMDVDPDVLKTDFVTVVGHKFYGPRIGALVIRSEKTVPLQSLFRGGSQEHEKRAGYVFSKPPIFVYFCGKLIDCNSFILIHGSI